MKNIIIAGIISVSITTSMMATPFNSNDGLQITTYKGMSHTGGFFKKRR